MSKWLRKISRTARTVQIMIVLGLTNILIKQNTRTLDLLFKHSGINHKKNSISYNQIIFAESLKKMTLSVSQKYGEIPPKFLITMVSHFMNSIGLKRKQQPHVILGVLSYT